MQRTNRLYGDGGLKGKNGLYDQSFRSPLVFYWKDRIQGTLNTSSLVSALDIVPTILDVAGVEVPEELPGMSLKPLLDGGEIGERTELVGYTDNRRTGNRPMTGTPTEGHYVRTARWHFLWYRDLDDYELYDVQRDPGAMHDLAAQFPDLVQRFKGRIDEWRSDMGMSERISQH